jgi:hypothetical protein
MFVVIAVKTSNYTISTIHWRRLERINLESDKKECLQGIYIAGLESLSFADYEDKYENGLKKRGKEGTKFEGL